MSCGVGEVTERLENELFTYVTAHSRTLPLLYLRHSSFSNPSFASPTSQALHLIHPRSRPRFFHAPSNQCNLLFILGSFQEKQLSLTETIKYEINKYMFNFIIFKFFCCSEITNLAGSKSRRWTPLVASAVLKPNYSSGTIRT